MEVFVLQFVGHRDLFGMMGEFSSIYFLGVRPLLVAFQGMYFIEGFVG